MQVPFNRNQFGHLHIHMLPQIDLCFKILYKKIERRRNAALTKTHSHFVILYIVYVLRVQKSTLFSKKARQNYPNKFFITLQAKSYVLVINWFFVKKSPFLLRRLSNKSLSSSTRCSFTFADTILS